MDVSFSSFLCAKEKDITFWFFSKRTTGRCPEELVSFAIGLPEGLYDDFHFTGHIRMPVGRKTEFAEFTTQTAMMINVEIEVVQGPFLGFGIGEIEQG